MYGSGGGAGTAAPDGAAQATTGPAARRVLVVSAGAEVNRLAGRALQEEVQRAWPDSALRVVDTPEALGPGLAASARAARRLAGAWLSGYVHGPLWRHHRLAGAAKRLAGAWVGRRLAPVVEAFDPDVVLSTYPLGTAGLVWLRRHRGLTAPLGAWTAGFAPHPLSVYAEVDRTFVAHPVAVPVALAAAPGARVGVCVPPVPARFQPGVRAAARRRAGLTDDRFVALFAGDPAGRADPEEAVRALLALGDPVQVVVACGRDRRLALRLARLGLPLWRLRVVDGLADEPALLQAADLVVTGSAGAVALEAVAARRPVLIYRPAAGDAPGAALMTVAGLAGSCRTPAQLQAWTRTLVVDPHAGLGEPAPVPPAAELRDLGVRTLVGAGAGARAGRRSGGWPLRAADAFFLHVQTPAVAQQIGAVLELGPVAGRGPLSVADLTDLLARRLGALPMLRRRFVARGRLRRPGWVLEPEVDPATQVRGHPLPAGAGAADAAAVIDDFWSQPLPAGRPPWQLLLVSGLPDGRVLIAIKLHHALGDGLSTIGALRQLLDDRPRARTGAPQRGQAAPGGLRSMPARGAAVVRGLARLARAGRAPRLPINGPLVDARRRVLFTALPSADLGRVAASLGVRPSELILGLVAEALHRTVADGPDDRAVRAIVPVSVSPRRRGSTHGNWTGAVALDLPIGPMPVAARVHAAREALRRNVAAGEPDAAALVMRLMGALPAPVHRRLARTVYTSRFFNIIVSYLPATGRESTLAGAPIRAAYPVVALADGVGIGVGALRWADRTGVGVILDRSLADAGAAFVAAFDAAFDALVGALPDR